MVTRKRAEVDNNLAEAIPDADLRAIAVDALLSPDPVAHLKRAVDADGMLLVRLLECVLDLAEDDDPCTADAVTEQ